MKKIAIISDFHPTEVLGGGGLIAHEFFEKLKSTNYFPEFWYTSNQESKVEYPEVIIGKLNNPKNFFLRFLSQNIGFIRLIQFSRILRINKPELVWFHQVGKQIPFLCIFVARIYRKKIFITLHDFLSISTTKVAPIDFTSKQLFAKNNISVTKDLHSKLRRWINRKSINCANSVFAVSNMQANILRSWGINIKGVINNGIQKCSHNKYTVTETNTILFAGRFHSKGLQQTLESVLGYVGPLRVLLAGEIALYDYAISQFPMLNFEYLGPLTRSEVSEILHECDCVFVLSQYFDPFPTIALEAAVHGVPFICTEVTGVAELIPSVHRNELVFKVGEIPSIERVLSYLKNNKEIPGLVASQINDLDSVMQKYIVKFEEF